MIWYILTGIVCFFIGLVSGAKIYNNIDALEKWAKSKLNIVGVDI